MATSLQAGMRTSHAGTCLRPPRRHSLLLVSPPSSRCRGTRRQAVVQAGVVEPGATVLVAGATGGVGQLVTARLLDSGYKVRALCRSADKAQQLFGSAPGLEVVAGVDLREPGTLGPAVRPGVDAVACCTGTTAFPSKRWQGGGPRETDYEGVVNLLAALPRDLQRFVLVSSAGVERAGQLPYSILNLFGVLKFKGAAEAELRASRLPYTILRPGRLTDGPYTSYDLNTLLQATSGSRQEVQLSPRDDQNGQTSRIAVAEAVVQALRISATEGRAFGLITTEGQGPGRDQAKWAQLFSSVAA